MTGPPRRRAVLGLAAAALGAGAAAPAAPGTDSCDARRFGAFGDGASHPLGARHATLADARRRFPRAASLAEETDRHALQAAVDAARAAGGGAVRVGPGTFVVDAPVRFPQCRRGRADAPVGGVGLEGAGEGATILRVANDFEGYVLDCEDRFEGRIGWNGAWAGFSIHGPGAGGGYGVPGVRVGGLGWGARRAVDRVTVVGCRVGLSVTGDQALIARFQALDCWYGIYFDRPNPALFGDQVFAKPVLDRSRMAAIGVHPDARVPKSTWIAPVLAACPFGIYKEMGGSDDFALGEVEMLHPQFERLGHAAIAGGAAMGREGQGDARPRVLNVALRGVQFGGWDAARRIPGWARPALLDLHEIHGVFDVDPLAEAHLCRPGDAALFRVRHPGALRVRGDVAALLAACEAAGRPLLDCHSPPRGVVLEQPGGWSGGLRRAEGAVRAGDVLVHAPGGVARATGAAAELPAGIALAPARGGLAALAWRGRVPARATGPEGPVRAGPDGTATAAGDGAVLGWVEAGEGEARPLRLRPLE